MAIETTNLSPEMAALSPAMRQYRTAKDTYPDSLLFFRMGDFYELFFEDAIVAARELQLTLTARDKAKSVPMCGVPYHAAEGYLQRLLRKGFRVAICEQMEDPKLAKGVVKREVTRVFTPGTAIDPSLSAEQSNYLASVAVTGSGVQTVFGLAFLDLSTGEFRATEFRGSAARAQLVDELGRTRPVELVFGSGGSLFAAANSSLALDKGREDEEEAASFDWIRTKTPLDEWVFSTEHALPLLRRHFHVHSLDGLGLGGREIAGVAAGALLHYMQATKQGGLEHVDVLRFYERSTCLELDAVS
ncbi:MAG TPA: DNA mismatch repair protein MutS, partial [Edaphobacter sp.]